MMTRQDYMQPRGTDEERKAAHRAYYGEIAEECNARAAVPFTLEAIKAALAAGDEHLNTLPLAHWDAAVSRLRGAGHALKKRGDYLTLGTGVCILKEAARRWAEED